MNRPRREHHPSIYRKSPYVDLPPTTALPKKRGGKSKNKDKEANVSPFNLGNTFNDEDVKGDYVMITGEQDTGVRANKCRRKSLGNWCNKLNPLESTNARRYRFRVTDEEPEHFGDDVLPWSPGLQRIAKSQCSGSSSTTSFGSNPLMYQQFMKE
nr:hypothetical protein [Tanacetum cinerariifolium]